MKSFPMYEGDAWEGDVKTAFVIDEIHVSELRREWRAGSALPEVDCREAFGRFEPCPVRGVTWEQFLAHTSALFGESHARDVFLRAWRDVGITEKPLLMWPDWQSGLPVITEKFYVPPNAI